MLAARPEIDRINRIVRWRRANVAQRHAYVARAGFLLYRLQHAERQSFRRLDARPDRCAESQIQLTGGDSRKNLPSEIRTEKPRMAKRRFRIRPSVSRTRCSSEGVSSASGASSRRIHVDNTGTSVLDNRYEAAIANPTASESGTKSERETPVMKKDGTKTARIQSIARSRGICTSLLASSTATALPRPAPRWL